MDYQLDTDNSLFFPTLNNHTITNVNGYFLLATIF